METIATVEDTAEEIPKEILERIPNDDDDGSVGEEEEEASLKENLIESCPHCGMNTKAAKPTVSEDDRNQWVRYILSGGVLRFRKEYSLYGGRVRIVLQNRTAIEDTDVDKAVSYLASTIQSVVDFPRIRIETMRLRAVYSLVAIEFINLDTGVSKPIEYSPVEAVEIRKCWDQHKTYSADQYNILMDDIPSPIIDLISEKTIIFDNLCAALTIEGLNPDF